MGGKRVMVLTDFSKMKIYLKPGPTDMRKSINTLGIVVQESMKKNLFSPALFVFCGKRKNNLKILYWEKNGFCLWQKKLEEHKFKWPVTEEDIYEIDLTRLTWLLSGLDFTSAHQQLKYSSIL